MQNAKRSSLIHVPEPKIFIPRGRFQTEGSKFIVNNPRCQLNVDMGLGKTIMTINALDSLFLVGYHGPALILGPVRVAGKVWSDEVLKWTHTQDLIVSPIVGDPGQRRAALRRDAAIYTVNYENIPWLIKELKGSWPFKIVVADESTKLKSCRSTLQTSPLGKRFIRADGGARLKELSKIAHSKVHRWINLTGTFSPNGLEGIWGQLWFIDGGERLGKSFTAFQNRWFRTGFNGFGMEALPYAETEIREKISDVCFTLRAEDYLDLPQEIINNIYVDIPPQQMLQYKQMEKDFFVEVKKGSVEAFSAASKIMKLRQIANGSLYVNKHGDWEVLHDAKIEALREIIDTLGGEPCIVIYTFKTDLVRLQKAFPHFRAFDKSAKTQNDFSAGRIPGLFLHPGSAGHGVDGLQLSCNTMIFFSLDWNAEERLQAIARIGAVRQFQAGFDRPVKIHQLIAAKTVDELILTRLEGKLSAEASLKDYMAKKGFI